MRIWTYLKSLNKSMLMAVVAVVVFVVGSIWFTSNNATNQSGFKCPEEYGTSKEYLDDLAQWIRAEMDKNPEMTVDELFTLRNKELLNHRCRPSPLSSEDAKKEAINTLNLPQKINFTGNVVMWMTYGRILVKNVNLDSQFAYFIAEPDDVVEDGASRYSPMTGVIRSEDTIKIIGEMTDECWWNEKEYGGCVPLVEIRSLQQVKNDKI